MLVKILRPCFCLLVFGSVFYIRMSGMLSGAAVREKPSLSAHSAKYAQILDRAAKNAASDELRIVVSNVSVSATIDGKAVTHLTSLVPRSDGFLVLDSQRQRVMRFDKGGKAIGAFGKQGIGPGSYLWPSGIYRVNDQSDPDAEDVWITDFRQARVNRLAADGTYRTSFPVSAERISAKGVIQHPDTGELYVCGNRATRNGVSVLHSYDRNGNFSVRFSSCRAIT